MTSRPGTDAKSIAYAFYDSYNQKDLDASFEKYISKNLINHALGGLPRAAWLASEKMLPSIFDDLSLTVHDQVAEGNKVATRLEIGGTQTGDFPALPSMGLDAVPASGNGAILHVTAIDLVEDGQIVEHWADMDFLGWYQQMSAQPTSK